MKRGFKTSDAQICQDSSSRERHGLAEVLSIRPYPTCCRRRGVPVTKSVRVDHGRGTVPYLGECDIWNHNHVEGRRSVLLDAGVTSGVILVWASASVLPGLAVVSLGDSSLRRGARGRAG
jgi:hypothetical protein